MFDEPAENKLLKLLKEGAMREAHEEETASRETDNRLLRILRDKKKKGDERPAAARPTERGRRKAAELPQEGSGASRLTPPPDRSESRSPSDRGGGADLAAGSPRPRRDEEKRDAQRILAAARTDEPAPSQRQPEPRDTSDDLRDMLKAVAENAAPLRASNAPPSPRAPAPTVRPPGRADGHGEPATTRLARSTAAPAGPTAQSSRPAARQSPPPKEDSPATQQLEPPTSHTQQLEPPVAAPAKSIAGNTPPPAPTAPRSPALRAADAWPAPEGGLALTLLLKGDQIDFLLKMSESGQSGSLVRTMLVAQCLMGGQGEWGLAGLLQEYARALTGALNKLMIREKLKKEVDLAAVKDRDLDGLLEEIRDLLEDEDLSSGLDANLTPASGLLLGVRLSREDVAFLRKLASPRGELTLVGHLLFTQALMAYEVVPSSPWPLGPAAVQIREEFKRAVQNYRELQKTLLNQILVNARLGKKTSWGAHAARHEAALAELARSLKACLP